MGSCIDYTPLGAGYFFLDGTHWYECTIFYKARLFKEISYYFAIILRNSLIL